MAKQTPDISIIDRHLNLDGSLKARGKLVVRGSIKGTLSAESLIIAKSGAVLANADVVHMSVSGTFEGEARVSGVLTIFASGCCSGRIQCKNIVVEPGGELNADVAVLKTDTGQPPKEALA